MRLSTAVFSVTLLVMINLASGLRMLWKNQPTLNCFKQCNEVFLPICASDGSTYVNECQFENARCQDLQLFKLHAGDCGKGPENRLCRPNPYCNRAYKPVCGSNGETYSNPCQLFYDACFIPDLQIAEFAPCKGSGGRLS